MKLRIKGNSLRFRISPTEMARLLEEGRIVETVYFGLKEEARLTYALEQARQAAKITARYARQEITVEIPAASVRAWSESQEVGLYGESETQAGVLELAIEKDFACLDETGASNADTYPNPKQGAAC